MSKQIFASRSENPLDSLNKMGNFFTGADPTSFEGVELDPFVSGYSFIYWVRLPEWFKEDEDLRYFQTLTQKTMVSFNGFSDVELQESSQQYGFAGNETSHVTGIQKGNTDFTIGFKEYSGTPLTKMVNKWVNLIRDKNTGIALYPKLYNVEYSSRNHTGILLYISMRPDVTNTGKDNVEKAFLYSNVFPLNVSWSSLFNYELGSVESPTSIDVNFKGVVLEGPEVDAYAKRVLDEKLLQISEDNNNGLLFLNSIENNKATKSMFTSGILKEIYNNEE